jgi:tRNA threonylcarbamoyladenosine biosynthesis protein TsaE
MGTIISRSAAETYDAGRAIAERVRAGEVLGLVGDLGAGKTHWVKGLVVGLGSDVEVTSPTFTLIHEYGGGRLPVYHVDCYRLETPRELAAIGIEEYMDGRGLLVVEWADKFPELLPAETRWVRFAIRDGDEREISGP